MLINDDGRFSELFRAYQSTEYGVITDEPFSMYVGKRCLEIKRLFEKSIVNSAIFITAFNPRSEKMSDEENVARLFQMEQEIKAMGYQIIEGIGIGKDSETVWTEKIFLY